MDGEKKVSFLIYKNCFPQIIAFLGSIAHFQSSKCVYKGRTRMGMGEVELG